VVAAYFNESFTSLLAASPYVAIFLLLTGGIWLIPFSEEIALIAAGYLYYSGEVHLAAILSVSVVGVFLGDFLAFWLGKRWGRMRFPRTLAYLDTQRWLHLVSAFLDRHGLWALFWARFLPGVRLPMHILVGMHGIPVATYVRVSLLSAVLYVPIIVALAVSFGDEIDAAFLALESLGDAAWIGFFLTVLFWLLLRFWWPRLSMAGRRRTAA
jgi:membrane protein DedA with SNARE-associated domain